jgi:hypothetical protein
MFIRTGFRGDDYINSDDIVRIRAGRPREVIPGRTVETVVAILRDGTCMDIAGNAPAEVVAAMLPVIPAAPGFEALWTVEYEDDPRIDIIRHPVLGWREDPFTGGLVPVTLDDEKSVSNVTFAGVKYPDGQFVVPACARYASEKEWFEEIQNEARERRVKPVAPF